MRSCIMVMVFSILLSSCDEKESFYKLHKYEQTERLMLTIEELQSDTSNLILTNFSLLAKCENAIAVFEKDYLSNFSYSFEKDTLYLMIKSLWYLEGSDYFNYGELTGYAPLLQIGNDGQVLKSYAIIKSGDKLDTLTSENLPNFGLLINEKVIASLEASKEKRLADYNKSKRVERSQQEIRRQQEEEKQRREEVARKQRRKEDQAIEQEELRSRLNNAFEARVLAKEYNENVAKADIKYKNKRLEIKGQVIKVAQDTFTKEYFIRLRDDSYFDDVICYPKKGQKITTLTPGQIILLECICDGFSIINVEMKDCRIILRSR